MVKSGIMRGLGPRGSSSNLDIPTLARSIADRFFLELVQVALLRKDLGRALISSRHIKGISKKTLILCRLIKISDRLF